MPLLFPSQLLFCTLQMQCNSIQSLREEVSVIGYKSISATTQLKRERKTRSTSNLSPHSTLRHHHHHHSHTL
ncbi:hypothetical protein VNO80_03451 [Phaseolus coccineus]|uniref:Uncharacterized protein n=1 Tax=Phaseolus coccineus TaxID=3886 RepID=A0AAN9NRH1_PHACN